MSRLKGKHIAVLMGGPGSERPVSLAATAAVSNGLRALGANVTEVDVQGDDFVLPPQTQLAFINVYGTYGEDGQIQRELERRDIPYTGEGVRGSELAFDKIESKRCFLEAGVPTPAFEVVAGGETPTLPLPYVIKAPKEGSSVGIYIVKTPEEVAPAVAEAAKYGRLLVEEFVPGRELTVSVLANEALPVIEIIPRGGFYDFKNKYPFLDPQGQGAADHFCPAPLDEETTRRVQELAIKARAALGLEVYSRVDFLLRPDGEALVLEINTIPGMTQSSLLPEAAAAAGIGFPQLCERIVDLSLAARSQPQ